MEADSTIKSGASGFRWMAMLDSRWPVAFLLLTGMAERVLWCVIRPGIGASGEAFNVAAAIANGRGFADAYQLGQGPTAHLLPISPAIAGSIYALFGVNGMASEFILACWSLGLVFGAFLLLFATFQRLGMPRWARLAALAFLCLAPAYIAQESVDFRIWEGGLTSFLAALLLYFLVTADRKTTPLSALELAGLGSLMAVLFFVNPPFGLAGAACGLLYAVQNLDRKSFGVGAVSFLGVLAVLIVPWTMRNSAKLGEAVMLRSNAGLELALANHPAAVDGHDPGEVFLERLQEIHPAQSHTAYSRMQAAGGEVAYSRFLAAGAIEWLREHPAAAARIAGRHLRQIIAPQSWQYTTFGSGKFPGVRAFLASVAGVLGLVGIGVGLAMRRRGFVYLAILTALPALLLMPFQPVPRYTYIFFPLLSFCAADLLSRSGSFLFRRTAEGDSPFIGAG